MVSLNVSRVTQTSFSKLCALVFAFAFAFVVVVVVVASRRALYSVSLSKTAMDSFLACLTLTPASTSVLCSCSGEYRAEPASSYPF